VVYQHVGVKIIDGCAEGWWLCGPDVDAREWIENLTKNHISNDQEKKKAKVISEKKGISEPQEEIRSNQKIEVIRSNQK
jgi:hypothetical protein